MASRVPPLLRRGLAVLLAALAGPVAAATAAPPGIVGADDRRPLTEPVPELAAVGRVNGAGAGFCTGVLVAPAVALTAAHCLWNRRLNRPLAPDEVHFVAGYRRGRHVGHARARAIRLDPGLRLDANGFPQDLTTDWALLDLERPLAGPGLAPLPFAGAAERARVAQGLPLHRVGYGQDRPHLPVMVAGCHALGLAAGGSLLLHDCDAGYGDAGSPILVREGGGGYAVVALQTALFAGREGPVAAAVVLARRADLPASALLGARP